MLPGRAGAVKSEEKYSNFEFMKEEHNDPGASDSKQ